MNKARKITIRQAQGLSGAWNGYISGKPAQHFPVRLGDPQAAAEAWHRQALADEVAAVYGAQLARLAHGRNQTALSVDTQDAALAAALVRAAEAAQLPVLAVAIEKGRATRQAWLRVTVRAASYDIEVSGVGDTVLLFSGQTAEGTDWLDDNLQSGPRLGASRAVEHRFAGAIIQGAADAGLRVRVQ
jgi:hypothetical protein